MKGRLIHHYRVDSLLGEGGMGTVYQATDTHLNRPVAIKMLHTHLVNQVSFMERFRNEAMILARLNHPNIAVVYNFLQDGADYAMAMEYVEGDSLEMLIRKAGALSPAVAAEITRQGLEGLAHAHRKGVLHRDIKPANLMLTPDGAVKLMDFGIARVVGEQRLTQANRVVGTLEYMAPELIQGQPPSTASDLYAMGILLYELLSGKLPFASRTDYEMMQAIIRDKPVALRKLNAQIPKELEAIVLKALDKNPAKRFTDAKEFQRVLQPYFSQAPTLNPAQLMAPVLVQDILNMQPTRQPMLAETKVATGPRRPVVVPMNWITENWQMLLAGGLILVSLLFFSLIFLDDSPPSTQSEIPPVSQSQVAGTTPETQADEPLTTASSAGVVTPGESTPGETTPAEVSPAPVEESPTNIKPTPKPVTPPSRGSSTPADKKQGPTNPDTKAPEGRLADQPKQTPGPTARQDEPVNQPVQPVRTEPVVESVAPKSGGRKSVFIRRLRVNLALSDGLSSDGSREGQSIRFRVTEPVTSNGMVVIEAGATAYGEVSRVKQADVLRKKNLLEFRIQSVEAVNGKRLPLRSATISEEAKGEPVRFRPGQTFEVRTGEEVIDL